MQTRPTPFVLTLVAARKGELAPRYVERARQAAEGAAPDILSEGEAVDIACPTMPDLVVVRGVLAGAGIDAIASRRRGRRKGLLVADMDSTIVDGETLDELARKAGSGARVEEITRASMNGALDFGEALRARVATLGGAPLGLVAETIAGIRLNPGAAALVATMRANRAHCALVSGGFTSFTAVVARACGFDSHHANVLLDDGVTLTGQVGTPILDRDAKRAILRELAAARSLRAAATLAVGDGANDLAMLREAGLAVGYRPKPVLADAIPNRLEHADLRALLFAQGYRARDIVPGRADGLLLRGG